MDELTMRIKILEDKMETLEIMMFKLLQINQENDDGECFYWADSLDKNDKV